MTETAHTRSRRASLGGLVLQLVAFAGIFTVSLLSHSLALRYLAWFVLGGVPLWFVALLVFRQRELAALESLDLEELRRERQTAGGEALFDEGGFRVAETRLRWMLRWLVPAFGLINAAYLGLMGAALWRILVVSNLGKLDAAEWPKLLDVPVAMVIVAVLMLATFLFSRYASGMGRVREWQLLRGCGSFMLGNALFMVAVLVALGVEQYAGTGSWEHVVAWALPFAMMIFAAETLVNFVLDIYRPRAPGAEPRAAFDSRLLGLIAEPGGIASSIAEAINYQFGFQVSQSWFYKLLERAFVPLVATGALALWLLTCVVIIQPYEHAVVERFGQQLNATNPLGPGIHLKWPWPIEVARAYNTGQLHQIHIGYKPLDAVPKEEPGKNPILLWTDTQHFKLDHFDFLLNPSARDEQEGTAPPTSAPQTLVGGEDTSATTAQPVHLIRMDVVVQYRIRPDQLGLYTQAMADPHRMMLDVAWEETSRYTASLTVDDLMNRDLGRMGTDLRQRLTRDVASIGLEVVYVGVTNVHPEKTVAEAYRNVVKAEQEKVAAIRAARVMENQRLSAVAGDATLAYVLADAVTRSGEADTLSNEASQRLAGVDPAIVAAESARVLELAPLLRARILADAHRDEAKWRQERVEMDFTLGLGRTFAEQTAARAAAVQAEADAQAATAALDERLNPLRAEIAGRLGQNAALADALIQNVTASVARTVWEEKLSQEFVQTRIAGQAAEALAQASAERWEIEMKAAADLARVENERQAYHSAPRVFKTSRLVDVLVAGLKDARKFFLAFDAKNRTVRVRFVAEDTEPDVTDVLTRKPQQ